MRARVAFAAALGLVLAGPAFAQDRDDPLTRPVALQYAEAFGEPGPPRLVHGATWSLGSPTLAVTLIDSGAGLVLIDAGLAQWAPVIEAHLEQIGYAIADVKLILSTEPHYDHASGLAALARDSGAKVLASAAGAEVLRAGHSTRSDPQLDELFTYAPVPEVTVVSDGEVVRLGALELTAHATPGHTPGSLTWSWQSCANADGCRTLVAAASLTSRTDGTYRYSAPENAGALAAFRDGLARLKTLPCDQVLPAHPPHAQAAGATGPEPCKALSAHFGAALDAQLEQEAASGQP
ncbi:MBL fold metallo-hydrolase [Novosphingobium sp. MBES04]|uniref:MBL fold metallo-hydrolase n=1 Tax=Novosphingobium sp. MBES04 TaxID=1206458 RepID=UPI000580117E|nr:MBL fold metallo-hydrolase [Novosphingobium sp. MBES04]GAM05619.1 metallo-beta-lactamase [Novosphingobium sp. MBES04]